MGVTVWWQLSTDSQDKIEAITKKWEEKYKPELDLAHIKHEFKRLQADCTFELDHMQTRLEYSGIKTFANLEAKVNNGEIKFLAKMPTIREFIDMVVPGPKCYVIENILGQDWREYLRRREDVGSWNAIWVYPSIYFGMPADISLVEGVDYLRVPFKGFIENPGSTESIVVAFAEIKPDKFYCSDLCKTQPFENEQVENNTFIHMLLCDFLADVEKQGHAKVHVNDEADYYSTRSVDVLLKNFGAGYDVIARVGKMLGEAGWKQGRSK
jgi:hypothetical protein